MTEPAALPAHSPARITNVTDSELDTIRSAFAVWERKLQRNRVRSVYFDAKMPCKDLGISTPPSVLAKVRAVLSWPAKACGALAVRSIFDGFVTPDGSDDPLGLSEILDVNRFDLELPQLIMSAYKHSCSFMTVTKVRDGDRLDGRVSAENEFSVIDNDEDDLLG